jgi:hypothetical protein
MVYSGVPGLVAFPPFAGVEVDEQIEHGADQIRDGDGTEDLPKDTHIVLRNQVPCRQSEWLAEW